MTAPRHALVVPSVVIPHIGRGLKWRHALVSAGELINWSRIEDLTERSRDELARLVVQRLRHQGKLLSNLRCGLVLCLGWQDQLGGIDGRLVQEFTDGLPPDRQAKLCDLTMEEFSRGITKPFAHSLRLLAKLEAHYWSVEGRPLIVTSAGGQEGAQQGTQGSDRPDVDAPAFKDDLALVSGLPWVDEVGADDVRFRTDGVRTPAAVLADLLGHGEDSSRWTVGACRLVQELARCERLTFAQEVEDLGHRALNLLGTKVGTRGNWVRMFVLRYVSPTGGGRSLLEVGGTFGVTREYVRQICDKLWGALRKYTISAPATSRVLAAAARIAPESVTRMNQQLARMLGEDGGFESAVFFATELGLETSSVVVHESVIDLGKEKVYAETVNRTDETELAQAVLRSAGRQIALMGCTNLRRVAGALAFDDELAPGRESLKSVLSAATGFKWLDEECGWFTLGDRGESSAVAKRVRKMAAAAEESLTIESIVSSLVSDDLWLYREKERDTGVPPMHIMTQLLRCWPWLKCLQHNRFVLCDRSQATTRTGSHKVADSLSSVDRLMIQVIKDFGGVATRNELSERIASECGIGNIRIQQILGTAPMLVKVEFGLYALRGHRMDDDALGKARYRAQVRRYEDARQDIAQSAATFLLGITSGSLKNEQYSVPGAWAQRVLAGSYTVVCVDGDGELMEKQPDKPARVRESGIMVGLNRWFPQAVPGDILVIEPLPGAILRVGLRRPPEVEKPNALDGNSVGNSVAPPQV